MSKRVFFCPGCHRFRDFAEAILVHNVVQQQVPLAPVSTNPMDLMRAEFEWKDRIQPFYLCENCTP